MGSSLKRGLERIKATHSIYNTPKSPEELFMMFYTQFEHTDAMRKSFNLSQARKVSEEEVCEEARKCTIHCNFCARLKTMQRVLEACLWLKEEVESRVGVANVNSRMLTGTGTMTLASTMGVAPSRAVRSLKMVLVAMVCFCK